MNIAYTLYSLCSRLTTDKDTPGDWRVQEVLQVWRDAISTRENQVHLLQVINMIRTARLNKYQLCYHSILDKLSNISKLQTEALRYWINTGNISHIEPDIQVYPNVTMTCFNPQPEAFRQFYRDLQSGKSLQKGTPETATSITYIKL